MSSNPYESPADTWKETPPYVKSGDAPRWPYRPATLLVQWLNGIFWTLIIAYVVMLALQVFAATALTDFFGQLAGPDDIAQSGPTIWIFLGALICAGLLILIAQLLGVVFFCIWVNRANKNARALGALGMSFSPGWSVGWFFVPIANLVMPYKAVREIYLASEPGVQGTEWQFVDPPALLRSWWAFWVLSMVVNRVSEIMSESVDPQVVKASLWVGVAACGLSIAAAYTCLRVVKSIHARQEKTAAQITPATPAGWS